MKGAWLASADIAISKSWTARAFDMSTDDLYFGGYPDTTVDSNPRLGIMRDTCHGFGYFSIINMLHSDCTEIPIFPA